MTMKPPRSHFLSSWLTVLLATVAFSFTTTTAAAFYGIISSRSSSCNKVGVLSAERNENEGKSGGALGKKAYNDDALYNFHMMTQAQKIRDYSAMDTYVDTNSLWNLAWHDSFVRNGLSDFVPPLTDTLNVLVIGGSGAEAAAQLENGYRGLKDGFTVEDDDPTTTTNATAPIAAATEEAVLMELSSLQKRQDSSCSFLEAVFDDVKKNINESAGKGNGSNDLDFTSYDCIMDQGLIADLCATSDNKEEIGRLLWEATKRIRDNGIYVANTPPLPLETREYLTNLGKLLGLQWEFDLDGISDSDLSVSVARKYFKDELPSFGKLAKVKQ